MAQGFSTFTLNEYRIGLNTDPINDDYQVNYSGGKYLTLLNSFIPAGSYILPGGDENAKVPLIPKVSYLVEAVHSLTLRINKVGRLSNANITLQNVEASPLVFAWSDSPIFTQAPMVTSSIENYITGATHSQVDNINGEIVGLDLDTTFLTLYPIVGVPAFNFFMRAIQGDPSNVDDTWVSLQVFGINQGGIGTIAPCVAQGLSAIQADATQRDYASLMVLRAEISHNIIPVGFGNATDSDAIQFNITPTNQFAPSRQGNVAFTEDVSAGATDTKRIVLPANFFCETIIMSTDFTTASDSTVNEQFLHGAGGTVENTVLTLTAVGTEQITQINRIISETLELTLVANASIQTEFLVEFRGQVIS